MTSYRICQAVPVFQIVVDNKQRSTQSLQLSHKGLHFFLKFIHGRPTCLYRNSNKRSHWVQSIFFSSSQTRVNINNRLLADMVVSGVPNKTDQHACQVAMMSLDMVTASRHFTIPHMPGEALRIRVGLHSGTLGFCFSIYAGWWWWW